MRPVRILVVDCPDHAEAADRRGWRGAQATLDGLDRDQPFRASHHRRHEQVGVVAELQIEVVEVVADRPVVGALNGRELGRTLKAEGDGESPAARWSHAVQRRPWTAAIAATALLLALAAPALGMRLGFPDAGNDPPDTMTRQAYDLNTEGFGPGTNGPLVIAAELPDPDARGELDALATRLRDEDGVAFVPYPQINDAGTLTLRGKSGGR